MAIPGKGCAKTAVIVAGLLLILAGVGLLLFNAQGAELLRRQVETHLTQSLGVRVTVGAARPHVRETALLLEDVSLMNPPGFGAGPAVEHGRVRIVIDPGTLLSAEPRVSGVTLEDTTVHLRHEIGQGINLRSLIERLRARPAADPPGAEPSSLLPWRRWRVDEVRGDGATVRVSSNILPAANLQLELEPFALTEFDGQSFASTPQLAAALLRTYGTRALAPGTLVAPIADALKAALEGNEPDPGNPAEAE